MVSCVHTQRGGGDEGDEGDKMTRECDAMDRNCGTAQCGG